MSNVKLHLYDISGGMAKTMSMSLLGKYVEGIWHSGIVVFGKEYFWGGVIQISTPGSSGYGMPTKVVDLGVTNVTELLFEEYLAMISENYTLESYSLLENNCNHFSDECSQFLTGNEIPYEVSKLPQEIMATPFGQMIQPFIQSMEQNAKTQINNSGGHWTMMQGNNTPVSPVPIPSYNHTPQKSPFEDKEDLFQVVEANINPVINKIVSNLDSEDEKITMRKFGQGEITPEGIEFLVEKSRDFENGEVWRYLYLLQNIILDEPVAEMICSNDKFDYDVITRNISGGYVTSLMSSLICVNLFSSSVGKAFLMKNASNILDIIINVYPNTNEKVKQCLIKIIFNYCISLPKESNETTNTISFFLLESMNTIEEDKSTALKSLGYLLHNNPALITLLQDIGYTDLITSFTTPTEESKKLQHSIQTLL